VGLLLHPRLSRTFEGARMTEFATTTEIVRAAKAALEPHAWDYIVGGSETETALRRNRIAIESLAFRARILRNVEHCDTATSLLGTKLRIPYILAPVGSLQDIHPTGTVGQVRAACAFGTLPVVSSVAGPDVEVSGVAAPGDKWFQLYVRGDIDWIAEFVGRARKASFKALVITVDTAHYSNRERQASHNWKPEARRNAGGKNFQAQLDWKMLDKIRKIAKMPVIVKGIQTAEDATLALKHGVDAVWVSNHGGRQLDHARGTLEILPEVVAAVRKRVPVIVDGGFTRGTDVIKAIALGADVVAGGKMTAWALAAGGQEAVERMLELVGIEIETTMALLGVTKLKHLDTSYIARADASAGGGPFPLL
jgi:isopentenyl diphosphate isomerase/L-lactate dehydrogenase-like FMN-dependent dehydrogenase